jgi:hypothetical protein
MEAQNSSAVRPSCAGRAPRVRLGSDGRSFRIRSRSTNDPKYIPKQANPRAQDRRRRDLVEAFVCALGGLEAATDLTLVQVRKAAELVSLAEAARAAALTGGPQEIDIWALIRIENTAARAVRQLGLKVGPPPAARGLQRARERWAAAAAREASATKDTEASDGRVAK